MANKSREIHVSTYVLMDLEATGLPGIGETPRVVEMSFVAVQRSFLEQTKNYVPRILDKLTVCVNPSGKPMTNGAALITDLYNDALETLAEVDSDTVTMLRLFLSRLPQPVCLLAHNGNKFDFPMLKMEIERVGSALGSELLCADTLEALRSIDSVGKEEINSNVRIATDSTNNAHVLTNNSPSSGKEVTPQKSSDEDDLPDTTGSSFSNPPPAPRKKRSFTDVRKLGSTMSAKRRLLQEDGACSSTHGKQGKTYDRNGLTVGEFCLGTTASSPPPSPHAHRSGTRRQLPVRDADANVSTFNGAGDPSSRGGFHRTPDRPKTAINNTIAEDTALLPFPDDFSDDEENVLNQQTTESKEENTETAASCSGSAVGFTDSLPDDELLSAVDEVLNKTALCQNNQKYSEDSEMAAKIQPATEVYSGQATPSKDLSNRKQARSVLNRANYPGASSSSGDFTVTQGSSHTVSPSTQSPISQSRRVSYKLPDIYKRLFSNFPSVSHTAEDDCISLLRIVQAYGSSFDMWVDENAVPFSQIKKMY